MAKARAKAKASDSGSAIVITRLREETVEVPIIGLSPVIPHRWSEKARRGLPGHPDAPDTKEVKGKRQPKEEADACLYKLGSSLAMPATAFKAALVGACRFFDQPSMVEAKQLLFVVGEGSEQLVKIAGTKELHEDLPRNANGNPDLRYRYYVTGWSATLKIKFIPTRISKESVVALVDAAGRGGVGDWRPSAPKSYTGTYGTFRLDESKEVRYVK